MAQKELIDKENINFKTVKTFKNGGVYSEQETVMAVPKLHFIKSNSELRTRLAVPRPVGQASYSRMRCKGNKLFNMAKIMLIWVHFKMLQLFFCVMVKPKKGEMK